MIAGVTLHNLFSYADAEFDFAKGVTSLEGFNYDDDTPEGSGKSAIPNTITWVCFGKLPKDATIDSVIRDTEDSGYGLVRLRNGGEIYRSRNPNDLYFRRVANGPEIRGTDAKETQAWIQDLLGMGFETFCQAVYFAQNGPKKFITASETDKAAILSEIQDLNAFTEARKAAAKLCTAKESELKTVEAQLQLVRAQVGNLEQAVAENLKLYQDFQAHRAVRLADLDAQLASTHLALSEIDLSVSPAMLQAQLEETRAELSSIENAITEIQGVLRQVRDEAAERVRVQRELERIRKDHATLEAAISSLTSKREEFDLAAIVRAEAEANSDLTSLEEFYAGLKARSITLNRVAEVRKRLEIQLESIERQLTKLIAERQALAASEQPSCPTCGGLMDSEHVASHLRELDARRNALEADREGIISELEANPAQSAEELEQELRTAEGALKDLRTQFEAHRDARGIATLLDRELNGLMTRRQALEAELSRLQARLLVEPATDLSEADVEADLAEAWRALKVAREREKGFQREYVVAREAQLNQRNLNTQLDRLKKARAEEYARNGDDLEAVVTSCRQRLAAAQVLVSEQELARQRAFEEVARLTTLKQGFSEVKSYVFRSILKELNKKANRYLSELFQAPCILELNNEGDEGEISKITATVTYDGIQRPLGLFSGGQLRRIILSVDLALSDLMAARSHNRMDFRIFDESMKDLSEGSCEKFISILERLEGTTLIIEHNSLVKSIVSQTIRVELRDGVSRRIA